MAADFSAAPASRARRFLTPATVHVASLVLGLVVLLILGRDQWFFGDDWAILAPSLDSQFMAPHVGHWNLIPALVFPAVRTLVGLGSYLPYLALALLSHLAVVHLSWRILLRCGANAWLATVLAGMLIVFGGGAENILWAFQFGFMGALALGLLVVLLLDREKPSIPLVIAISVIAPMFSGTALAALAAAGVLGWIRRGFLRTALTLLPAFLVYLSWYLLVARGYPASGDGVASVADLGPALLFGAAMVVGGLGRALPFIGLGVIPAVAVLVWLVLRVRRGFRSAPPAALALAAGAFVFVALTSFSRVANGLSAAASERYAYVMVVLLLPVLALILTSLAQRSRGWSVAVVAVALVLVASNTVVLTIAAAAQAEREAASRARVLDSLDAVLRSPDDTALLEAPADPQWAPDLHGYDLLRLHQDGQWGDSR
jgi:hypothetical protein